MYRAARALLIHAKRDRYPVRGSGERYFAAARRSRRPPRRRATNSSWATWRESGGNLGARDRHRRESSTVAVAPGAAHATNAGRRRALACAGGTDRRFGHGRPPWSADRPIRRSQTRSRRGAATAAAARPDSSAFGHRGHTPGEPGRSSAGTPGVMHMATGCGHASGCTLRAHGRSLAGSPIYSTGGGPCHSTSPAVRAVVMEDRL